MLGFRWVRVTLLLVAAAVACVSGSTKGDTADLEDGVQNPWIYRNTSMAVPAESQQVSVVVASDQLASATGYGKGYGKGKHHKGHEGYKAGHHDKKGYNGEKGHKEDKGYKKRHYGDYGKDHKMDYHDKGGKKYKGHEDKHKYYGDDHKGKKGKKGHHYGTKGHHNKGHKDKGFKNVYHKEEYTHSKKYYDDFDNNKYHNKYDEFDSYHKGHKGKDYKGGNYKGQMHLTIPSSHVHSQKLNEDKPLIMISKVRTAIKKINDIQSKSKNEKGNEVKLPLPSTMIDPEAGTMRYVGRVLLDTGETSSGRTRFQEANFYDGQCQVFDLRMIRKYLKYCLRHTGTVGEPIEGEPSCSEEDFEKIKKYLAFCKEPFFSQASKRDKKQYKKLAIIANKLDKRNNIIEEEEVYYPAEVCNVQDLRQMEVYLKDCHSGKEATEEGKPACDLTNFQKSLDFLSSCQNTFFLDASRQDKGKYDHLLSLASSLIERDTQYEENRKKEELEESNTACQVEDLREAKSYVTECQKLMQVQDYQKLYGRQVCRRSHLRKINRYLIGCERFFTINASEKDRLKYMELMSLSDSLGMKPGKQSRERQDLKPENQIQCNISDLKKVPDYLQSCEISKTCKIRQLSKVHEFLLDCEEFFVGPASKRDRGKYGDLLLKSEMLSTRENIHKWREETNGKRKHVESVCKLHVLKKVPAYLKGCLKSRDCKIKQLLKVQEFLLLCEDFFILAASPRDRGKYIRLEKASSKLIIHAKDQKGRAREMRRSRDLNCNLNDLRKIPLYLDSCAKEQSCKQKQLEKVYQFLFVCEIPLTSTASRKDKDAYRNLLSVSKKRIEKRETSKENIIKRHSSDKSNCGIKDLKKIPSYLEQCKRANNCNSKMLLKIHGFLQNCISQFTGRATPKDKKKYRQLEAMTKSLITSNRKTPKRRSSSKTREHRRETGTSECKIKDLRKIPNYLSNCLKSKDCKKGELSKVESFLKSCKYVFMVKEFREDKRKYNDLFKISVKLTSRDLQKESRGVKRDLPQACQVRKLRRIKSYLGKIQGKIRISEKENILRAQQYLNSCQKILTKDASPKDKKQYRNLMSLTVELTRGKPAKHLTEKRKKKPDSKHQTCKVNDLRTAQKLLSKCKTNLAQKGKKIMKERGSCGKTTVNKIQEFLTSCRKEFLQRAPKSDRRQYEALLALSKTILSSKPKIQTRKGQRSAAVKPDTCKVQELKNIQKNLKICAGNIKHAKGNQKQTPPKSMCKQKTLLKVSSYLKNCQKTFLKNASVKDKHQYRYLTELAAKLSKQLESKPTQRHAKTPRTFSCQKKDLETLKEHYNYCKAQEKIKKNISPMGRRERSGRVYRKTKQDKAKVLHAKRQFTKCESAPRKSQMRNRYIENEGCKSRRRSAANKNRQGGKHHDKHGKKGHHEKGKYHDDHKGHKGHYEHKGHYGDKSSYGKKGGHKGKYGHDAHKGHGHDDHHGGHGHDDHHGGYGHNDHHGGYGHDDHHGGHGHDDHHGHGVYGHGSHHGHGYHMYPPPHLAQVPMFCYNRDYCVPLIPPRMYSFRIPFI